MFVFEDQCGLLWGETVGQGDRDSTLKGCTQNLTPSWTQGKSNNLKGVWVTTPADFGESPGKVGGNGAYHQQTDTGGGHFQDLVLPLDTGAGKNHFGVLSLGFPGHSDSKESAFSAGDLGSIPSWG